MYQQSGGDFPFKQDVYDDYIIRIFDVNIDDSELIWHKDKQDRIVEIIENDGWYFQYDNELPFLLENKIEIKKETYHRVIKGNGILKIKIVYLS